MRLSLRRLQKQNLILEEKVEERTQELNKININLVKQKALVDEKNKDILDSIKYAKRLQDAILPTNEFIEKNLANSFVLYKPKDIVSGDFYWMAEKNNKVYFAAVDCTGHGVPGAIVSIVGHNGLSRALKEFDLHSPAEILDKLNDLVEETFHQLKDGMDIALCVLDKKTGVLEYSGANNPLYIIRKKEPNNIEIIKADKQPIGSFAERKPFTNHKIKLEKEDVVYIFSDGFADQFGGDKGKKFKYAQFRQVLIQNFEFLVSY